MNFDKASFDELFHNATQSEALPQPADEAGEYSDHLPMIDELDLEILMHRDAHFDGRWDVMSEYYRKQGRGVHPEIELERIEFLAAAEKELGENLAGIFLRGHDAEDVAAARDAYRKLRDLYDDPETEGTPARLIADLILSEEEDPFIEVTAIAEEGPIMCSLLADLLNSNTMSNPLFPGYGQAPMLAARCLGAIGDERSIVPLFEAIRKGNFSYDTAAISALRTIGEPAKKFLLKVLTSRPITDDNYDAATALAAFSEDEQVRQVVTEQLADAAVQENELLKESLSLIVG